MPVNVQNRILETVRAVKGDAVAVLNAAAKADAAATRNLTPIGETGLLRRSIKVKRATQGNMQASRQIGGDLENGKPGTYVLPVNYGYPTSKGHVAGHFMHEGGIEEGINTLKNGVKEIARNVNSGRRGRAMTIQADTDEQVAEFFFNEGVE